MKPSPFYDRLVDVMEELFKFTLVVRDRSDYLTNHYSERKGRSFRPRIGHGCGRGHLATCCTGEAKSSARLRASSASR